jgi:hypothetical protein
LSGPNRFPLRDQLVVFPNIPAVVAMRISRGTDGSGVLLFAVPLGSAPRSTYPANGPFWQVGRRIEPIGRNADHPLCQKPFPKLLGYARVSTTDQKPELQIDALLKAGVDRQHLYEGRMSGLRTNRPQLAQTLTYATEGDALVVWQQCWRTTVAGSDPGGADAAPDLGGTVH